MECIFEPSPDIFSASTLFHSCVYVMYGIIFFTAFLGNGLVCIVVYKSPRMKTVTNYFIVNLAVGDILMTVFCVPFSFVSTLILRYWPFGGVMCKVVNYSQAVSVLVNAYTLLAISIDRYMAITRPMKPRLETTAAKLVVAAVWFGALCTAAPIPIVSQLYRPSLWHEVCQENICGEQWPEASQSQQYTCALLTLQFVLPLSALVCTYTRIAYVVWGVRPPGEAQTDRDLRMQSSKRKMVKMMVTVVAAFTICWLPLNIFIILWNNHSEDENWIKWPGMPYVWFACHWLAMSHTCYNPIIYCFMNTRYRRAFKQIFESVLCTIGNEPARTCHRSSVCEGIPMSVHSAHSTPRRRCTLRTPPSVHTPHPAVGAHSAPRRRCTLRTPPSVH
ncbi:RYamide receptor-like [Epargyreus clarus]|uniref:RYamide receptor-like n=1 Tax=Epargyreus clarus TaxID=520877 RepID=UPI003C30714A